MKILKEELDALFIKTKYIFRKEYEDVDLNRLLNGWFFLETNETIIQELTNETLEIILYSKYYWCSRYKDRYFELYGQDAGIEQQQYKIIQELEQRLEGEIDWEVVQMIEEDKV